MPERLVDALDHAVQFAPQAENHYNRGLVAAQQGDDQQAIEEFEAAHSN